VGHVSGGARRGFSAVVSAIDHPPTRPPPSQRVVVAASGQRLCGLHGTASYARAMALGVASSFLPVCCRVSHNARVLCTKFRWWVAEMPCMAYAEFRAAHAADTAGTSRSSRSNSMFWRSSAPLILAALVSGCASAPTGPSVMVLPGLGKSFEQFNADDAACRQWGLQATGRTPAAEATTGGTSAVGGTPSGDAGGTASTAPAAPVTGGITYSGQEGQWRYDIAYQQCMYSRGHQIPGVPAAYRGVSAPASSSPALTPKPLDSSAIPPPPPGPPPPPPPGISR